MKSRDELLVEAGAIFEAMKIFLPPDRLSLPIISDLPMVLFERGRRVDELPWEDLDWAVERGWRSLKEMEKMHGIMSDLGALIRKKLAE